MSAGEVDLRKLDSSVKRNSGLVKKLRQVGDESRQSLLEDIAKTNQSKVRLCIDSRDTRTIQSPASCFFSFMLLSPNSGRCFMSKVYSILLNSQDSLQNCNTGCTLSSTVMLWA